VSIDMVEAAASRIRGYVRRTPMIEVVQVRDAPTRNPLYLKLESLQVTGAFKARGAMNRLLTTPAEALKRGIVTASGGNHGVAVARAGFLAGVPTTVYLPPNASRAKINSLSQWNATARIIGERWDDADAAAESQAERDGWVYFHPFKDPGVVAGQGTVALEMLRTFPMQTSTWSQLAGRPHRRRRDGRARPQPARSNLRRRTCRQPDVARRARRWRAGTARASMDASGHHVVRHDGANDLRHCRQTCGGDRAR
jgi:threonine dehydratase